MSTAAAVDVARDLYERHARQVYSLCLRRLGSREEAEDAAQTVFLNAFGALQRGSQPRFERAWLWRIAENVCRDRRRRTRSARDLHALEDVLASPERDPDALAGIEQALATLPERQRRAIVLREWHGLSYREIGAELDLSDTAAEALAFRARRTLADQLRGSRPSLSLLGWLKPAAGGSAATKVAAVVAVVAVGGGAATGHTLTRDERSPARPTPATAEQTVVAGPQGRPAVRVTAPVSRRSLPGPAAAPATPEPGRDAPTPAPEAVPPASAPAPAATEVDAATEPPTPSAPADTPGLPVDVTDVPVDTPELPVGVPPLPPPLPPVEVPPRPPLPPVEAPVEPPPLPDLPPLP